MLRVCFSSEKNRILIWLHSRHGRDSIWTWYLDFLLCDFENLYHHTWCPARIRAWHQLRYLWNDNWRGRAYVCLRSLFSPACWPASRAACWFRSYTIASSRLEDAWPPHPFAANAAEYALICSKQPLRSPIGGLARRSFIGYPQKAHSLSFPQNYSKGALYLALSEEPSWCSDQKNKLVGGTWCACCYCLALRFSETDCNSCARWFFDQSWVLSFNRNSKFRSPKIMCRSFAWTSKSGELKILYPQPMIFHDGAGLPCRHGNLFGCVGYLRLTCHLILEVWWWN